ncbi:hypothetical protein Tco_0091976, partial [Tanacetum coccineum]
FKLDIQEIVYTVDILRDTLKLPVDNPDNPFVPPVNIEIIESFMHTVGYQGVVDKVSGFYTNFLAQLWQTMFKVFNRYLTTKTSRHDQTKINILQLFMSWSIAQMMIMLLFFGGISITVYFRRRMSSRNVTIRGMLIPDAFLTKKICATDDCKESTPRANRTPTLTVASPQGKKRKQSERDEESYADKFVASMLHDDVYDSRDRIEPGSHKEHLEVVDDDDENKEEKKDDEMGNTVLLSTATTSEDPYKKRCSSKYSHLPGALHKMCRHQKMIRDMERKCVTTDEFCKVHGKVDQVLHEIVPQLAEKATNDLIDTLKRNNVIQVHPTTTTSTDTTSSADLQQQLYLKMKSNLQDQANDPTLDDYFHSQRHDDHQEDDAPPEVGRKG